MNSPETTYIEEQEPAELDEATLAAIDKAQKSYEAGEGYTIAQARELTRRRYQAWLSIIQDPSMYS
jgi:hypothetical protein